MSRPADPPPSTSSPEARLGALARRAELTLLWERLWPPLASAGALVALFLAVSWGGLWFVLPVYLKLAALALFVLGLGAALFPLHRLRRPTHDEALTRIDRDAPGRHRPASAFEDRLADADADAQTRALWALHRARLAEEVKTLEVASPAPGLALRDPRALRFAALLIAAAAFLAAGPERYARFLSAFDFRGVSATAASARVDAWIDPPAYTNKPPILLSLAGDEARAKIAAPEDSVIVLRAESAAFDGAVEGRLDAIEPKTKPPSGVERRFAVHGDGVFRVLSGGATLKAFDIESVTAAKPTISLIEPPQRNLSGSLSLRYRVSGAYGIVDAQGAFAAPGGAKHVLVEPPKFALPLPNGAGEGRATVDLSESPWAGAAGELTLSATDAAGKTGASEPLEFALPERAFANPLARALVEQRRQLIMDPDAHKPKLAVTLAALMLAPDRFGTTASVYLGLRAAAMRLERARDDKALLDVAVLLWAMALQIEDAGASRALQELRAAQQQLREALKNGAGDEEIRKLTQQLRDAAQRYMQEMARNADRSGADEQPLDAKDLQSMLDRLEDSARNGARADAEAMLDELQNMFENMRGAQSAEESAAERELNRQMNDLDKLLREQQTLRDDTFRSDERDKALHGDPNAPAPADPSLAERQKTLAERLDELKKGMKGLGLKPEKGLDGAAGDMRDAEGDLQSDGAGKGPAVDAQGRALEELRKGMQGLQQQLQAAGSGRPGYRASGRQPGSSRDPLGRNARGERGAAEGTLNEGPEAAARARRVQQELRRRLANPNRPTEERDYLERLLKPE